MPEGDPSRPLPRPSGRLVCAFDALPFRPGMCRRVGPGHKTVMWSATGSFPR